jgi:hypothetical protein
MPGNPDTLAADINALLSADLCADLMAACNSPEFCPLPLASASRLKKALNRASDLVDSAIAQAHSSDSRRTLHALREGMVAAHRCLQFVTGRSLS